MTAARRCIERWRRERSSRKETIPDRVWAAAAAAAGVDGIWATSRELRLEFNRLKARVQGTTGNALIPTHSARAERAGSGGVAVGKPRGPRKARFVEVVVDPACAADRAGAGGKAVIDLVGRQGERMRIEIAGQTAMDVVALSQTFWGRQP